MWLSYLWQGYRNNEHEVEARHAAADARAGPLALGSAVKGGGGRRSSPRSLIAVFAEVGEEERSGAAPLEGPAC